MTKRADSSGQRRSFLTRVTRKAAASTCLLALSFSVFICPSSMALERIDADAMPLPQQAAQQNELTQPVQQGAPKRVIQQQEYAAEAAPVQRQTAERQTAEPRSAAPAQQQAGPQQKAPMLLKGQVNYTIPTGTPVKLKLATVPTHGMKLLDRDLDGKLFPARLGEVITAKTSEDIYVDDNKVIPEGTIFHGTVSKVLPPKRVNRPGSLEISFDSLTTPDGKKFAFRAQADNIKQSTMRSKARGAGIIAGYAAGGAIVGALVAYQLFGLENTIACHGYNIAGGAAGGALLATGYAVMRKGPKATLEPGDDLNMQFDSEFLMPAAREPVAKVKPQNLRGVSVDVQKTKLVKDGLDGHLLRVDALITNNSNTRLKSMDLFLEDSEKNRYPLCGGPEEQDEFLFDVDPHSYKQVRCYFQVEWPKLQRELIWLDHQSRQVCYRDKCP